MRMLNIGILGSTNGSNLYPLIETLQAQNFPTKVSVILSNQENAGILEKARRIPCPAYFICPKDTDRKTYDQLLSSKLKTYQTDLVILIGYMRILSEDFVSEWKGKILNIHPSLLPAFAGKMDLAVHQAVIDEGLLETGCTVHEVTAILDAGPILVQKKCAVHPQDTAETLKKRVQSLEVEALAQAIYQFNPGYSHATCND